MAKAEVRFNPTLTDVETLADGITSLGYTARHLSTSFPGQRGGESGGVESGRTISVQVTGIRGPECVAKVRRRFPMELDPSHPELGSQCRFFARIDLTYDGIVIMWSLGISS